jgi:acetylornithine/LysW-gamma-L-lysine aminotransferase
MTVTKEWATGQERDRGMGTYGSRDLCLVRGSGSTVWDENDRPYLDLTSMYGVAILGHAHPAIQDALSVQAGRLVSCFGSFANDQRALLLEALASRLTPLDRFFLCNSGAEAVEGALKMARHTTGRSGFVAAMGGFHGRTMGALSVTFKPAYRKPFEPLLPGVTHVPFDDLAAFERAMTGDVAAVILEAVQGEGGVRPASDEFLQGVSRLCDERGALLIMDEVQTGCGRTGWMWGFQAAGITPDIACMAKGIAGGVPFGCIAAGPRVKGFDQGDHASTFGGNPLACAASLATLRVIESEALVARAARVGSAALDRLRSLSNPRIREVRGRGLMLAVELKERAAPFIRTLQERGVLALNAGPTAIRFLPSLTVPESELFGAIDVLGEILG